MLSDDPIRRTTLAALSQHLKAASRAPQHDRLLYLHHALDELIKRLDMHRAGVRHCTAADVYNSALLLAAYALLLAERGSAGYPYAAEETTGQQSLNLK